MFRLASAVTVSLVLALGGCAQTQAPFASSISSAPSTAPHTQQDRILLDQAEALDRMSKDLVRKTTFRGAAIGAVAGCGFAVIGGSAGRCAQAALAGGVIGGVAGHVSGKAQVQNRVELVELSRVLPSLRQTSEQVALVSGGVDDLVASQDAEIRVLKQDLAEGVISQDIYDERLADIRDIRAQLAEALSLSAAQAKQANQSLREAKDQGQTGVEWYINATSDVEDQAVSARAQLSLL